MRYISPFDLYRQCEEAYEGDLYQMIEEYYDSLNKGENSGEDLGKDIISETEIPNS